MLSHVPTVAEVPGLKESSQNRRRREVFPTLEFPTRTTLKRRSGSEGELSSWGRRWDWRKVRQRWNKSILKSLSIIIIVPSTFRTLTVLWKPASLVRAHAYINASLLANRPTPQGCWRFISCQWVYIFLTVWRFFFFTTLQNGRSSQLITLQQVWEVVLLYGDDPLEMPSFLGDAGGLGQPLIQVLPYRAGDLLLFITDDKKYHSYQNYSDSFVFGKLVGCLPCWDICVCAFWSNDQRLLFQNWCFLWCL